MFCKKCGGLMLPSKSKKGLACASCGHSDKNSETNVRISEKGNHSKAIEVIEKSETEMLPKIRATCNKCKNEEAFYWHVQTRAADEPETRFNRCTKCGHTWRSYG
ncbi:transcription factor S [Candidatus Woesearchaeota archaeon]|nr:transcription factor S [Candidatus Woesearchaeota archaeon]